MNKASERYEGKPLLRLLECYVLLAIGELSPDDQLVLDKMTPKLQEVYKCSGRWDQIVEKSMELPAGVTEAIRSLWSKNKDAVNKRGLSLDPQKFAEAFVDENFT